MSVVCLLHHINRITLGWIWSIDLLQVLLHILQIIITKDVVSLLREKAFQSASQREESLQRTMGLSVCHTHTHTQALLHI